MPTTAVGGLYAPVYTRFIIDRDEYDIRTRSYTATAVLVVSFDVLVVRTLPRGEHVRQAQIVP